MDMWVGCSTRGVSKKFTVALAEVATVELMFFYVIVKIIMTSTHLLLDVYSNF